MEDRIPADTTCSCGKPLYVVFNSEGKRIGVTHIAEDEDHHFQYFEQLFNPKYSELN